ncbi:MAG: glycosyltransferase family 4 protein, partial [Candidatus Micrarchaeaceae archaeon]
LWAEPWGLVVTEAMAVGRPVVAFRSGGIPEQVIDGETGFLVNVGDVEAMRERILQLANDFVLSERMGESARELAERKFDVNQMVDRYLEVVAHAF